MRIREDCVNGIVITEGEDAVVVQQTDTEREEWVWIPGDGDVMTGEAGRCAVGQLPGLIAGVCDGLCK
jgi:hypothetical protein